MERLAEMLHPLFARSAADAVYSKFNGYMPNEINLCYTEYIDCNILNYTGCGGK